MVGADSPRAGVTAEHPSFLKWGRTKPPPHTRPHAGPAKPSPLDVSFIVVVPELLSTGGPSAPNVVGGDERGLSDTQSRRRVHPWAGCEIEHAGGYSDPPWWRNELKGTFFRPSCFGIGAGISETTRGLTCQNKKKKRPETGAFGPVQIRRSALLNRPVLITRSRQAPRFPLSRKARRSNRVRA